ncbi:hypothetical protein bsdcttw_14480 [Anaerocolumna chitinilytica]|uniref:Uncharacterized protein n=1 Tax=Anaerocolumna chitinilytica TaxID=1727145 RepID=A0A7I8DL22_9FIRM|nr:hypothetical protein bsdcttw_14480 [Anaerocolumna chitinilytica]
MLSLFLKFNGFAIILLMLLLFFISYYPVHKWHSSVRQMLKLLFSYNIIMVFLVVYELVIYLEHYKHLFLNKAFVFIFTLVYFGLWYFTSLVAKSETAKLVNEIISVLLTILFTAGTYISSLYLSSYPSLETLEKMYKNEQELEVALSTNSELIRNMLPSIFNYILTKIYLLILPFLCISLFSMVTISIKAYWLKRNNRHDIWDDIDDYSSENNAKSKIINCMDNIPDNITDETEILIYLIKQLKQGNIKED